MSASAASQTGVMTLPTYRLDGRPANSVLEPKTEEEAVGTVDDAIRRGLALVPWGGGTSIDTGNPLRAPQWAALVTNGLDRVIDYSPDDMVVTVGAGTPLGSLQLLLGHHNQFLPLDPPDEKRATLGGITATNAHGLFRASYGQPRDRLLAARMVLSDGTVARAGAKVVKNVAGYDLCKLVAGSWGTLGLITEVTYKTNPIPPHRSLLEFGGAGTSDLVRAGLDFHARRLQPSYIVVSGPSPATLHIGLAGSEGAVSWQTEQIRAVLTEAGLKQFDTVTELEAAETALRNYVAGDPGDVQARITVRPTELPEVAEVIAPQSSAFLFHVAVGVVEVGIAAHSIPDAGDTPPAWWAERMRERLPRDAHLVWTKVPGAWKSTIDVWGPVRPDFVLMRGIKEAFDRRAAFSPGRFVGHI